MKNGVMFDDRERIGLVGKVIVGGQRDIAAEYRAAARELGGKLTFLATEKQFTALLQAGGNIPEETHPKLPGGVPVRKEPSNY